MTEPSNGSRPTRAVILWAYAVVLVVLVLCIGVFLAMIAEGRRSDRERACQSRISTHAADIRDDLDSTAWDSMAARVLEGRQIDTVARAQQISDLRRALAEAGDVRSRSSQVCAENPDFTPPN